MMDFRTKQRIVWLRDSFAVLQVPDAVALFVNAGLSPKSELVPDEYVDVEAVIVGLGKFGVEDARPFPNLKTVARFGAGADNVDSRALWVARGITATSTIDLASRDVAEFALANIIMTLRGAVRDSNALGGHPSTWRVINRTPALCDAVVGIIGAAGIGYETARIVAPLASGVLIFNRSKYKLDPEHFPRRNVSYADSIFDLAEQADVISIHVALNDHTRHMLDKTFFDALRASDRSIALVNTARGEIIDEEELLKALNDKTVHDAAIDVWSAEGPRSSDIVSALRMHPSVLATSHIGSHTNGVLERYSMQCARNVVAILANQARDVARYIIKTD